MQRKIKVRSHRRRLKDGRILRVRRHDRIINPASHRIRGPEIASTLATRMAAKSVDKRIIMREVDLSIHTDRKAIKELEARDKAFYDPSVKRVIQSAAPNAMVGDGAVKQLNAELTTEGKEITRRALKYMARDGRKQLKSRDIQAAFEEIQLERRTSEMRGREFDVKQELKYGTGESRRTAEKIEKLYQ